MSLLPNELRAYLEGNYVNYRYQGKDFSFAKIIGIDKPDGKENEYRLYHKDESDEIYADENELGELLFTPDHLAKMNFHYNPTTLLYTRGTVDLIYHGSVEGNFEDGMTVTSPTLYVFKPMHPFPIAANQVTNEMIENNTYDVRFVHYFQNYCTNQGLTFDFSVLQ